MHMFTTCLMRDTIRKQNLGVYCHGLQPIDTIVLYHYGIMGPLFPVLGKNVLWTGLHSGVALKCKKFIVKQL